MTTVIERPAPRDNQVLIRPAQASDADALRRMYRRCGADSRYARFHGVLNEMPSTYLDSVLGADPHAHDALVAETAGGDLVALGSAARMPTEGPPVVEIGLLVEDRWQQRGIGSSLLGVLAARARRRGMERLRCDVLAGNRHLLAMLRRHTATLAICYEGGVAMVEADLR